METIVSKSVEFRIPLWLASLDLKKAFDRIEWSALFHALQVQNVPQEYCTLLAALYDGQVGSLGQNGQFDITRGVKQGDVLSPMLFNAGLEIAIRRWKQMLTTEGVLIGAGCDDNRLTNVRFADDLVLYANSAEELARMLDLLAEELAKVGLTLNAKKSKIFTTCSDHVNSDVPIFLDAAGDFIEVARAADLHKYLGCMIPGDLKRRGRANLEHRLHCAWAKFGMFKHALTDKHVDMKLRLRLLDAVVTPCALYGLTASPLTKKDEEQLSLAQRKMLRLMVGYVKAAGDSWADMYRQLRVKVDKALQKHPVRCWKETLHENKSRLFGQVSAGIRNNLTCKVALWQPDITVDSKLVSKPARGRGRPRIKWINA